MNICSIRRFAARILVLSLFLGSIFHPSFISKAANPFLEIIPLKFERYDTGAGVCMMLWLRGIPGEKYRVESVPFAQGNRPWAQWTPIDEFLRENGPVLCFELSSYQSGSRQYRAVRFREESVRIKGKLPTSTEMIWIQPGAFVMGSSESEVGRERDEGPLTLVVLTKPYAIGIHEVTQTQYFAVMETNPSRFKFDPSHPVTNALWEDAVEYCRRLTLLEWAAGLLDPGLEYRLPTEAEWDYACRAGATTRFHYGDDPDYKLLGAYAWFQGNSGISTQPVMTRLPNAWGIYGMHGNVHEWCSDNYGLLPGGYVEDPIGPLGGGDLHIIRGGSWMGQAKDCRTSDRHRNWFVSYIGNVGFRIALGPVK